MKYYSKENIFALMKKLVACSSVSGTRDEISMARTFYGIFSETAYFCAYPEYLSMNPLDNDLLGRYTVTALVRGNGRRTVVLLNHFDTVDYESFGIYKEWALQPEKLMEKLDPAHLTPAAAADLASGDWVFGRGTGDMKFGGAIEAALTCELSLQADKLPGNILFLGVCDEENNSAGMAGSIPVLNRMKEQYGLEYVAVVNNEPHLIENGKHCMDLGTVGKVMPAFFCVGKEGHSSLIFQALNAGAMLAAVMSELEFSMDLVDSRDGVHTLPATALKLADTKTLYNVSMPHIAYAYYTVSTVTFTPQEITDRCKAAAHRAFDRLLEKINGFLDEFNEKTGSSHACSWENRVCTYAELIADNRKKIGPEFDQRMEAYTRRLLEERPAMDERDLTVEIVKEAIRLSPDNDPRIIIAYMPPFYPHSINQEETWKEKLVMACARETAAYSKEKYNEAWELCRICLQLSDISYCNAKGMDDALVSLQPNMPVLNKKYNLPLADLAKFDVPAINLGYYARDIHQAWERFYAPFALDVLPDVLRFAVFYLLENPCGL